MSVERYELRSVLGEGRMGVVYHAHDRLTGDELALKRIRLKNGDQHAALRLSLAREFNTLATLYHPNIIRVLDYGFDSEQNPFFTMDYLAGARPFVQAREPAHTDEQIRLLVELFNALAYLHRRGIIHRDLKPANVLIDATDKVKVLDFGLALKEQTGTGRAIAGTLAYMAPEVLKEERITHRSDLFAAGVLAYELLAGVHPFAMSTVPKLLISIVNQPVDLEPIAPAPLAAVLDRLLQKDPADRYPSAEAVIEDLVAAAQTPPPIEDPALRESYLTASTFVGRTSELARLEQALADAFDGTGSVWLVGGESGVGKSRLVDELRIRALVKGALVLRGQGVEEGGVPFQLWREAVGQLTLSVDPAPHELASIAGLLPPHHPLIGSPPPAEAVRALDIARVIAQLVRRCPQPLLIILEDLHWAEESLEPVRQLMDDIRSLPVLIVGTYRSDEDSDLGIPDAVLMNLPRLDRDAIRALSTSMIGQQASDPSLVDYLTRQTEGNAFFLVEVVRELAEQAGRLSDIPAMTLPERVVSEGVQSIVRRSLNRVPAEHRDLLKVAAVLGRRIEPPVLRALATTNLEGWIGICTAASVLEASGDVIRFAHDKLREGLIDSLEQGEYRALHKQAARALERHYASDPDQAARLALHWQAAGDPAKERQYTARAAEYANRLGASREAVRLYRRVLALTPIAQARSHTRVLIDLGRSLDSIAEFDEARTILEKALTQAQTLGETGWQVEILDTLGNTLYMLNEQDQAAAYLNQALAILPAGSSPVVRAGLLTGLGRIAWQRGDYATMLQADKAYLAALRQEGASADKIGSALNNLGFSALHMEAYDEAIAALKECLAVIDETNDAVLNVVAELNLAEVYRRTRQPQQAWPHVRAGLLGYTVHDLDFLAIEALAIAAGLFAIEGRLEQAAHLYAQLHQHDSIDVELRTLLDNVKADIIEHAGAETFNQLLAGIPAADLPALVDTMLARIGPSTG